MYTEADLPVTIKHGEILNLDDGGSVRWESNGEAKDIFLDSGFDRTAELWPDGELTIDRNGKSYKLTALWDDGLKVEVI